MRIVIVIACIEFARVANRISHRGDRGGATRILNIGQIGGPLVAILGMYGGSMLYVGMEAVLFARTQRRSARIQAGRFIKRLGRITIRGSRLSVVRTDLREDYVALDAATRTVGAYGRD